MVELLVLLCAGLLLDIVVGAVIGLVAVAMARGFWRLIDPAPAVVIRAMRILCIA